MFYDIFFDCIEEIQFKLLELDYFLKDNKYRYHNMLKIMDYLETILEWEIN